jgi:hypothetical protein|uniref:Uncharacterized protein n=1 Tax=alpha proteobacterium D323 TaxID=649534 RepID=M4HX21_9PROT|nr:hypothetical protein [alpha proteobacterium D323]
MHVRFLIHLFLFGILFTPAGTLAQQYIPAPVHAVSFDEWTAANARLANQQPLEEILGILGLSRKDWAEVNTAFETALATTSGYKLVEHYGAVFTSPAVGRFQKIEAQPEPHEALKSYSDFSRIESHLSVASTIGEDIHPVLQSYGFTLYQYTQEANRWHEVRAKAARTGNNTEIYRQRQIDQQFKAHFEKLYKQSGN